jgi:hypothetical protein
LNPSLEEYKFDIFKVFDLIHRRHIIEGKHIDEFVNLKTLYLREQLDWENVKGLIIDNFIETDGYYQKGYKSYGYRWSEKYRSSKIKRKEVLDVEILDKEIKNKEKKSEDSNRHPMPVHTWLKNNHKKLFIMRSTSEDDQKYENDKIDWINSGEWLFNSKDEKGHRFHSNLTWCSKTTREKARFKGFEDVPLVEVDVKNCQPLCLAALLKERKVQGIEKYIKICQEGLYEYLAEVSGYDRQVVKEGVIRIVFYAKPKATHPIKKFFKQEFPEVLEFINNIKKKDYIKFSHIIQRLEAKIMIFGVCERIRKIQPNTEVATVHDSLITLPEHVPFIKEIILEEFARYGVVPKLSETKGI